MATLYELLEQDDSQWSDMVRPLYSRAAVPIEKIYKLQELECDILIDCGQMREATLLSSKKKRIRERLENKLKGTVLEPLEFTIEYSNGKYYINFEFLGLYKVLLDTDFNRLRTMIPFGIIKNKKRELLVKIYKIRIRQVFIESGGIVYSEHLLGKFENDDTIDSVLFSSVLPQVAHYNASTKLWILYTPIPQVP